MYFTKENKSFKHNYMADIEMEEMVNNFRNISNMCHQSFDPIDTEERDEPLCIIVCACARIKASFSKQ